MPLLTTPKPLYPSAMKNVSMRSNKSPIQPSMETHPVTLRTPKQGESTYMQRRSLNISHFNALHNAVSNLARIDDFDLEQLGDGFFSDVFKATHKQTGKVMALKRNKETNSKMNILREIQLMNRLSHPNILKFQGVCVNEGQLHALTEYIPEGDLDKFVTNKELRLSWKQRIYLALDVAGGMRYLHSVGIFHRDLSTKNCLVKLNTDRKGKKYSCVVADLGLAEKIPVTAEDAARLAMVGTPYIMAPEVLHGKPYNEKADVFSFGLLVCQLIARISFDPEELPRSQDFGLAQDLFHKMVSVPPLPASCPDTSLPPPNSFLQLAYDDCDMDPAARPSFAVIVSRLEETLLTQKRNHVINSTSYKACAVSKCTAPSRGWNSIEMSRELSLLPDAGKRTRVNSTSKLARSYSDISREMIQHAASVMSSTFPLEEDDSDDDDDGFSNPFEHMEHLNCGKKLIDEPSFALLEMTFDLASSDGLKTSWNHVTKSTKKKPRPSSSYGDDKQIHINHDHIDHLRHHHHSSSSSSVLHPRTLVLRLNDNDSQTHKASCSEELLTQCEDCNYQRARHRAMILSPLGNHLASWWCSRHRDTKEDLEQHRQSMATVMSVLSKGLLNFRRSISVPDLSQVSSLFHHVDAEAENRILHTLDIPPEAMGSRSGSSDDLFVETSLDQKMEKLNPTFQSPSTSVDSCDDSVLKITIDKSLVRGSSPTSLKPPECTVTDLSEPNKSNNRDSGYEESLSNHRLPSPPIIHSAHEVKWNIPEESLSSL